MKAHISALLTTVEDERFLQSISAMLQTYVADTSTLTSEERAAIDEGMEDMPAGRTITHQQAIQNMKKRYPNLKPDAWKWFGPSGLNRITTNK